MPQRAETGRTEQENDTDFYKCGSASPYHKGALILFVFGCITTGMISEARAGYRFWPRYELTEAQIDAVLEVYEVRYTSYDELVAFCVSGRAHGCFIPEEEAEEGDAWGIFVANWLKPAWQEAILIHELTHAHEHLNGVSYEDAVRHKGWLGS